MQIKNFMQLIFLIACTFTAYAADDGSKAFSKEEIKAISVLVTFVKKAIRICEGRSRESNPRDNAYQCNIGIIQNGVLTIIFQKNAKSDSDDLVKRRRIKKEEGQEDYFEQERLQQEDPEVRALKKEIQECIIDRLKSGLVIWQSIISNNGSLEEINTNPACVLLDVKTSSGEMTNHEDRYEIVMQMQ